MTDRATVLADLNRQLITLASALLAIIVTVATETASDTGMNALLLGGFSLLLCICASLLSHGFVVNYVGSLNAAASGTSSPPNASKDWNRSALWANIAYGTFAFALVLCCIYGYLRIAGTEAVDAQYAAKKCTSLLSDQHKIDASDEWTEIHKTAQKQDSFFEVKFPAKDTRFWLCRVSLSKGEILDIKKTQPKPQPK